MKARSRLALSVQTQHQPREVREPRRVPPARTPHTTQSGPNPLFERYSPYLPTLFVGVALYIVVGYILLNVHPTSWQNILFPNSYLPFHLVLFLANFFVFSFLLLSSRRGYLAACVLGILVFLKLQQVQLPLELLGALVIGFVIIELICLVLAKLSRSHASFQPKPHTSRRRKTT